MHKYYFEINGEEFLIRVNISTGKYEIFNGQLELVEEDFTLFEVCLLYTSDAADE